MKGIRLRIVGQTILVFSTLFISMSAVAAASLPCGWYVEGNYGESVAFGKSYTGATSLARNGVGWSANAGFKFMPFFALEGGYAHYAYTGVKNINSVTAAKDAHHSTYLTTKIIVPVYKTGLEVFGKVGGAWINSKITSVDAAASAVNGLSFDTSNKTAVGFYFGAGAQFYFTPCLAANLQWARATGSSTTGSFDLYTAGLSYLFNF